MNNGEDFYKILGLTKDASIDEIKKSYRSLALKYHPDRNKSKEAEIKFKKINEAYEVLGDKDKKKEYDLHGWNSNNGSSGFSDSSRQQNYRSYYYGYNNNSNNHRNEPQQKRGEIISVIIFIVINLLFKYMQNSTHQKYYGTQYNRKRNSAREL